MPSWSETSTWSKSCRAWKTILTCSPTKTRSSNTSWTALLRPMTWSREISTEKTKSTISGTKLMRWLRRAWTTYTTRALLVSDRLTLPLTTSPLTNHNSSPLSSSHISNTTLWDSCLNSKTKITKTTSRTQARATSTWTALPWEGITSTDDIFLLLTTRTFYLKII